MTRKDNILQELQELNSVLATGAVQEVYSVPAGYFDGLAAQVLKRIKAMEAENAVEELAYLSPVLGNLSRQMPYTVPAAYFEGLAEKAAQLAQGNNGQLTTKEELAALSPLLSGLKKEMPYSVPPGYFESLTQNRTAQENKPVAKVLSFTSRKWFRYAAAAVITGMIVTAGFLFPGGAEKETGGKALTKFTRDVKKMNEVQKDNLMDFIDAGMIGNETVQVSPGTKTDEVKELLQGISDEELQDFQEQTEDVRDVLQTN
jgi:hypothetical protein